MLLAAACGTGQPAAAWEPLPAIASGTPYGLGVSALSLIHISEPTRRTQ